MLVTTLAISKEILLFMSSSDYLSLFGKRLANLRKTHGWSQERLALESGLARSYVGGIERGQRNLSLINIAAWLKPLSFPLTNFCASTPTSLHQSLQAPAQRPRRCASPG